MYKDILVPIDLNHKSSWKSSIPLAVEFCRAFGARLHIMTVVPDFGMAIVGNYFPKGFEAKHRKEIDRKLHELVRKQVPKDVAVQHIVAEGTAYKEILAMSEQVSADLILMASHRPELKDYLLGPNAEKVVRHSKRSVLVARPQTPEG